MCRGAARDSKPPQAWLQGQRRSDKAPAGRPRRNGQTESEMHMEMQRTWKTRAASQRESTSGGPTRRHFKTYHKAPGIGTVGPVVRQPDGLTEQHGVRKWTHVYTDSRFPSRAPTSSAGERDEGEGGEGTEGEGGANTALNSKWIREQAAKPWALTLTRTRRKAFVTLGWAGFTDTAAEVRSRDQRINTWSFVTIKN